MIKIIRKGMALFGEQKGLAQIPLMVALLLMAVAVPAVTKLSQQNQDNRNKAAGCPVCPEDFHCSSSTGYRCVEDGTPTKRPPTKPPSTKTPVNSPKPPTSKPIPSNVICGSSGCITRTPTKRPTSIPIPSNVICGSSGCITRTPTKRPIPTGCTCVNGVPVGTGCGGVGVGGGCRVTAVPTLRPTIKILPSITPKPTSSGKTINGDFCYLDGDCLSGVCSGNALLGNRKCVAKKVNGGTCGVDNDCASDWCGPGSVCKGKLIVGADCSFGNRCASGWCINFKCVASGLQVLPTITPKPTSSGKTINGDFCYLDGDCLSGVCSGNALLGNRKCVAKKVNGGTCGVDNDCASDWCGPGSVCKGKLIVGADCSFGNRCASGWCIDFKCVAAGGQPTKVQATVGPTRRLTAMPTQPVEGCTAVQASGSAKKCDGNTAMTCTKLANGSTIWKSTVCTYGCSGGKCNPAPTPGPIVLQPNDNKCACINGKIVNDGACQYLVGSACKYVTPIVLQPNDNKCACINGKIVNDGGCQYVIGSACKYVTPTVVAPTGACINGAHVVQASLLNCDPGTKRTCDCDNRQWSCFCDTNDDGDKTCIDSAKGNKLSNGTWAHLDDESSAKCICGGGNYHLNSNGKYVCGNSGGGNGGGQATVTPPRGGGGGACNSSSPKPADICVAKMLSIKPVCNNGEWDYEQQLCTAKGRTEVCGGKKYCCPSAGGAWTTNMTSCPNAPSGTTGSCKQCPSDFKCYRRGSEFKWFVSGYVMDGFALYIPENVKEPCGGVPKPAFRGKNKGDANCDGKIDVTDYSLWHKEFFDGNKGAVVKNSWHADFTGPNGKCDSKVDVYDFSLWQKFFNEFTKPD